MDRAAKEKKVKDIAKACTGLSLLRDGLGWADFCHSETNAKAMMELLDDALEASLAADPPAGIEALVGFLTSWVEDFERSSVVLPELPPAELLKFLMEENGLRQKDLALELGGQSVVSEILRGRRTISGKQAVALGRRFNLSAAAFLEGHHLSASEDEYSSGADYILDIFSETQCEVESSAFVFTSKRTERVRVHHMGASASATFAEKDAPWPIQ